MIMDEDEDPDFSWIQKEESILKQYQNIEVKPLDYLPITAVFVDAGNVLFHSRIHPTALEIDASANHSVIRSDKLIHIIQECKREKRGGHKWTWTYGTMFHIDIDISRAYQFSGGGGGEYLKDVDFCMDLVIPASPDIFHFSSQLFLFFENVGTVSSSHLPKSILKTAMSQQHTKPTKKVRIEAPSLMSSRPNLRKTKRAL